MPEKVIVVWIVEAGWPTCVDAARRHAAPDAEIVLLHVTGPETADVAHGAYAGLLGRGHPHRDPGTTLEDLGAAAARQLLDEAAARLGRPCVRLERSGRPEEEVPAVASGADLLVMSRDGDPSRPGPHSLAPAGRFVVDHVTCPVLLVWPSST